MLQFFCSAASVSYVHGICFDNLFHNDVDQSSLDDNDFNDGLSIGFLLDGSCCQGQCFDFFSRWRLMES